MSDKLRVLDLFAGIGGFSLGLERTGGFTTTAFCEIEKYPQQVLAKHWPGVKIYDDVRQLTADRLSADGIGVDVITGGFPCQDISNAGKGAGIGEGTRSGLWSECARLLGELRPQYAIFENVPALLSGDNGRWFEQVLWDISQVGYDAEWHCIPASELGAHHHRDRVWIIAYPRYTESQGRDKASEIDSGGSKEGQQAVCESSPSCCDVSNPASGIKPVSIDGSELEGGCETPPKGAERTGGEQDVADSKRWEQEVGGEYARTGRIKELDKRASGTRWEAEPSVGRVANGVPRTMDRLRCLGNAVCPPVVEVLGRAIIKSRGE